MPEGFPDAAEQVNGQEFLDGLSIGHYGDHPVLDHEGNATTLAEAMQDCMPARMAMKAQIDTLTDVGVDLETGMSAYMTRMAKAVEEAAPAALAELAKKKD